MRTRKEKNKKEAKQGEHDRISNRRYPIPIVHVDKDSRPVFSTNIAWMKVFPRKADNLFAASLSRLYCRVPGYWRSRSLTKPLW